MDRLETRELAYFVAVAEACHFGRAAERLGIAQPPLSRAISRLERRLGVVLLERTSRRVALTPAGETLLLEARGLLDAIDAAAARTRKAALPEPRLTLVMQPGSDAGLLPAILDAYRDEPGAVPVDVHTCAAGEQPGLLRCGAADVAFLHGQTMSIMRSWTAASGLSTSSRTAPASLARSRSSCQTVMWSSSAVEAAA